MPALIIFPENTNVASQQLFRQLRDDPGEDGEDGDEEPHPGILTFSGFLHGRCPHLHGRWHAGGHLPG